MSGSIVGVPLPQRRYVYPHVQHRGNLRLLLRSPPVDDRYLDRRGKSRGFGHFRRRRWPGLL